MLNIILPRNVERRRHTQKTQENTADHEYHKFMPALKNKFYEFLNIIDELLHNNRVYAASSDITRPESRVLGCRRPGGFPSKQIGRPMIIHGRGTTRPSAKKKNRKNILFNKRESVKFILSCCLPMSCSHFFPPSAS